MIIDLLFGWFLQLVTWSLDLLPSADSLPTGLIGVFDWIATALSYSSSFFPVDTFVAVLTLIIMIETILFLFNIGVFIAGFIRGNR